MHGGRLHQAVGGTFAGLDDSIVPVTRHGNCQTYVSKANFHPSFIRPGERRQEGV